MQGGMPLNVKFEDNSSKTLSAVQQAAERALEKCGLVAEGYAKRLVPNSTGNLRNSISHKVNPEALEVYVGTNVEYAPYVELGTGIYYPGGRPTAWRYKDDKGKWHTTRGQRAQPYLKPAIVDHEQTYKNIIRDEMQGK